MVSTRGHPQEFPEAELTPSKSTQLQEQLTPSKSVPLQARKGKWAHTPSNLAIIVCICPCLFSEISKVLDMISGKRGVRPMIVCFIALILFKWLFISLPLVAWDTGYVMLRPLSMPGGSLHWPLWAPYELYGKVDYIYGWKAFNERNGFTAAQGLLNIVESLMYVYYLYILLVFGHQLESQGRGAPNPAKVGFLGQQRYVVGQKGAIAVLVGYSAAVMTVSKTVLYWMNEYYSGFENIGHNSIRDLIFLWIIPNGAWIVLPSYMIYFTGSEILQGLTIVTGGVEKSSEDTSLIKNRLNG